MRQQEDKTIKAPEKVILGRITGVYGVKGWVKVFSYTDPKEAIVDYSPWYIRAESRNPARNNRAPWTKVVLKAGKRHAKTVVAKLEHCNDRDAAQAYIGSEIAIESDQLEALKEPDAYYWRDLIGLRVVNQQHVALGVVKSLMETGANDVLVVSAEEAGPEKNGPEKQEHLIPWTRGVAIIAVDLEQGLIEVDWDADF